MFSSFCLYKLDPSSNELLLSTSFWDELAKVNLIVPFSELPEKLAHGVDKIEGFTFAVPALGGKEINYHAEEFTILNYCFETKKVKPAILRRTIAKLEKIALAECGQPFISKEKKKEIKALATAHELRRAVEDRVETLIVINRHKHWIAFGAGSEKKCEAIAASIRKLIGSFPVVQISSAAASTIFTDWVKSGETPENSDLSDSCTLMSTKTESVTSYKKHHLASDSEVLKNIENFKEVVTISLRIGELEDEYGYVSCSISDSLKVSGFKFKINSEDNQSDDVLNKISTETFLFCSNISMIYEFIEDNILNYTVSTDEFS
ncbi:hypothetical protein GCM10011607_12310 [Shewanella inventionis]|uniref:Recombination-associated protein RdgC n=1 Tax=Shewanella inventionis TaxID=1738770 RepID=A0ABQ1IW37_9GAMM|nr:recombination-associated protein RdgC [Shewanella inventionis]GGB53302.1 hypothetical protein GCM10011607_12310 [Shewanella inventionis]